MGDPIALVSFLEFSVDLGANLGACTFDAYLRRLVPKPGLSICIVEPSGEGANCRLRSGTVTVSEEGLLEFAPLDPAQSRGIWAGAYPIATSAMQILQNLGAGVLNAESRETCWLLDLTAGVCTRASSPSELLSVSAGPAQSFAPLVRLVGDPAQIGTILLSLQLERERR